MRATHEAKAERRADARPPPGIGRDRTCACWIGWVSGASGLFGPVRIAEGSAWLPPASRRRLGKRGNGEVAGRRPHTRRTLLRSLGATAVVVTVGTGLAACATKKPGAKVRPVSAGNVATVTFQLYVVGVPLNGPTTKLIQNFVDQEFNSKHRGVRAAAQPTAGGTMSVVSAAILAGASAPVSLASCCGDWPIINPFLEPLDAYLRQDNVDLAIWPSKLTAALQMGGRLYGVPIDAAAQAYLYRQDILDQLGLAYPDPNWTYLDAAKLWTACTKVVGGKQRSGGTIPFSPSGPFPGLALLSGFGGAYLDGGHTHCLLAEPGSIRCADYAFHLLWNKACVQGDGTPVPGLATGQVVFSQGADPSLLWAVQNLRGAKWDFIPYPRWPVRPATIGQSSWYGLNAFAPDKDLAWELFRFSAVDTTWSRYYMRFAMAPPARLSLLEEWETLVRSVAPVLRTKALKYWREPAVAGDAYPGFTYTRYQPVQADTLVAQTWAQIWNRKLGVATGLRQITRQVDALQTAAAGQPAGPTAAQRIAQAETERAHYPVRGPRVATVPPGQ